MSCQDNFKLRGVSNITDSRIINGLEINMKARLDWGLLVAGGWVDVAQGMPGAYGGDQSELKPVVDCGDVPVWITGQVFQSFRKDWVYETGATFIDESGGSNVPIVPSILVDGVVQSGNYIINHPNGLVIFDASVSDASTVQAIYGYRCIQVYVADNVPWWKELQTNSFNVDDLHFQQSECGDWSIGAHHRIQMPTIIIDIVPMGSIKGYSIGSCKKIGTYDIMFHVLAESKVQRNDIVDILMCQGKSNIRTFDCNLVAEDEVFPLDCQGDLNSTGLEYPELVTNYPWHNVSLVEANLAHMKSYNCGLHEGIVHITAELIFCSN